MSNAVQMIGDLIVFLLRSLVAIVESLVRAVLPSKYKMKDVAGEIALVTGGGSGIGRLMAIKLAELGAIVVVWDINAKGMNETLDMIKAAGGTCYGYVCDLCDREEVYKKAALLTKDVGRVSILVNNAGIVNAETLLNNPDHLIVKTMEVNVMSHFWTVKAFLPGMLKENKGHILSIASVAGHFGIYKLVDYSTSKFAAVGFNEALTFELDYLGKNDIKTTVVCPYFIQSTGMFDSVMARISVHVKFRYIPTLKPEDVAERAIEGMRCNEKVVFIPGYFKALMLCKLIFPFKCIVMVVRSLVEEVAKTSLSPIGQQQQPQSQPQVTSNVKEQSNGTVLHQQLARRVSGSERKP